MNREENTQISFEAIVTVAPDRAVAAAMNFNGLFELNLRTGACSFLNLFPDEKPYKQRLFAKALKYQNKVIFVPSSAEKLVIYDLDDKSFLNITVILQEEYASFNKNYKFADGFIKEDTLFLIPSTYPEVVFIDLKVWTVSSIEINTCDSFVFRKGMCEVDNSIFVPSMINNIVLEFNYHTLTPMIHYVGERNKGCWSICNCNGLFYLAPKTQGGILCWNKEENLVLEIKDYPEMFEGNEFLFNKIYSNENYVYLIPAYANMFLKISVNDIKIQELNLINMENTNNIAFLAEERGYYLLRKEKKDGLFEHWILNTRNNELIMVDFNISSNEERWKEILVREKSFRENKQFNLKSMLKGMSGLPNNGIEEYYETTKMVGEQIEKVITS